MAEPGRSKTPGIGIRRCGRSRIAPPVACFLLLIPALFSTTGCANFWDEVTSRDRDIKAIFVSPDPMDVLAKSKDGDRRAQALRNLREPKQHGGSDAEQDQVVNLLVNAAVSERQPLCRMAAVQALGRFKDPRAVQGLIDAYYAVTELRPDPAGAFNRNGLQTDLINTFSPEMISRIQCQVLLSLGETGNPRAVELLTTVVREPRPEGQGKQYALDVRIAGARALAKYPQYQATEALVHVMRTEKNVALRDAAHESLQTATGKKLPPDAKAWEDLLHQDGTAVTAGAGSSGMQRVVNFIQGRGPSAPEQPPQ